MNNYFWPIYKNIEDEILLLSNSIIFDDKQLTTYSTKICELIIRCSVEIESIAKELYKLNGGEMNLCDANGKNRDLYFDTDCINKLQNDWNICDKKIFVSSENFYFKTFTEIVPLNNCNSRGKGKWKKAYQSLKHDRVNSIRKANMGNLIFAMGALYILNLYYKNVQCKQKYSDILKKDFDLRFGSDIFSVSHFDATACAIDVNKKIYFVTDEIKNECVYIKKYTDEWIEESSKILRTKSIPERIMLLEKDYDVILELNKNQNIYNLQSK